MRAVQRSYVMLVLTNVLKCSGYISNRKTLSLESIYRLSEIKLLVRIIAIIYEEERIF